MMPVETALAAFDQVSLGAADRQVANLVALEADLSVAVKAVMGVLSAQNAGLPLGVIGTVLAPMTILSAVLALCRRICLVSEVAPLLINQLKVLRVTVILLATLLFRWYWLLSGLCRVLFRRGPVEFFISLAEVEVALEKAIASDE